MRICSCRHSLLMQRPALAREKKKNACSHEHTNVDLRGIDTIPGDGGAFGGTEEVGRSPVDHRLVSSLHSCTICLPHASRAVLYTQREREREREGKGRRKRERERVTVVVEGGRGRREREGGRECVCGRQAGREGD